MPGEGPPVLINHTGNFDIIYDMYIMMNAELNYKVKQDGGQHSQKQTSQNHGEASWKLPCLASPRVAQSLAGGSGDSLGF